MARHDHRRLLSAIIAVPSAIALVLTTASCSDDGAERTAAAAGAWADTGVNAVSRPVIGAGVTAVTGLTGNGRLETAVYDLAAGRRRWARPATMAGRLPGMGVQPPAVVPARDGAGRDGAAGQGQVVALEPRRTGRAPTSLVSRDARTGAEVWARPVRSTFGPARCGPYVCLPEATATRAARFVALDPASRGRVRWRTPGLAEVQWSDARQVVLFRMDGRPALESRELRTGRRLWRFPVDRAVGRGVNLSGGWAFGVVDGMLVGSLTPYQRRQGGPLSAYGFFGLRVGDGRLVWARKRVLRVYPSPNPAVSLIGREVETDVRHAAFARLDPRTGTTVARFPAERAPRAGWALGFPADLSALGFLARDSSGVAFDLKRGTEVGVRGMRIWSFCTVDPAPLPIQGQQGFFPVAPLCAYDLSTGRRVTDAGPPPQWYTGAADGRRAWRDERGALHAAKVAPGSGSGAGSGAAIAGMHG